MCLNQDMIDEPDIGHSSEAKIDQKLDSYNEQFSSIFFSNRTNYLLFFLCTFVMHILKASHYLPQLTYILNVTII